MAEQDPAVLRKMINENMALMDRLKNIEPRHPPRPGQARKVMDNQVSDGLIKLRQAVLRYSDEHEDFPRRLEDVVPKYLPVIPTHNNAFNKRWDEY